MTRREIIARLDYIRDGLSWPPLPDSSARSGALTLVNDLMAELQAEVDRDEAASLSSPVNHATFDPADGTTTTVAYSATPLDSPMIHGAVGVAASSVSGDAITSLKDSFARAIAAKDEPPAAGFLVLSPAAYRNLEGHVAGLGLVVTGVDIKTLSLVDWPMTFAPPDPEPTPAEDAEPKTWRDRAIKDPLL